MFQKSAWLVVAAITLTVACATAASAQSSASNSASPVPAQKAIFKAGVSSSGWTNFQLSPNVAIYVPVKINGHDAMALLNPGESSSIDRDFATAIGLPAKTDAAGLLGGLVIEAGDVTLRNTSAKPDDMFTVPVGILGQPVSFLKSGDVFKPFLLGDEFFIQVAVDIDFTRHRLAFRDPKTVTKPAGAVELPLVELDGVRAVPVSIDGAAPAPFALHVSNVIGPMMATPSYAKTHQLLEGHPTSQRLSTPFTETIVTMDHVSFAGVDFPRVPLAIIPETALPPASINGDVGLPLLVKFSQMIIDYPHDRVFMVPDEAAAMTPVQRDRIGMILSPRKKTDGGFGVAFVSPPQSGRGGRVQQGRPNQTDRRKAV